MVVVTPSTFASAIASAKAGDELSLVGSFSDIAIRKRTFSPSLQIDASKATVRSLVIKDASGVRITNLNAVYSPDAKTVDSTSVVMIDNAVDVQLLGGSISSGPAVNGVPETALKLDATGNVVGWPTCRGITVQNSQDVLIESLDIHHLHRGVVVGGGRGVTLRNNDIHHMRKSGVLGGCDDLTVEGNRLHSNRPWRYGLTPNGDHGDFIAIWNGGKTVIRNIRIRNNLMRTGEGVPMMGGWVQGKSAGIEGVDYVGNTVIGGDAQGFVTSDVRGGAVSGNVMLQDRQDGKPVGIILGDGTSGVIARDNIAGVVSDKAKGKTGNVVSGNRTVLKVTCA